MRKLHLTRSERDEIRRLKLSGKKACEISEMLEISRQSVAANLRRLGLDTRVRPPKQKILEALRRGWTGEQTAAHFGVCPAVVSQIRTANGLKPARDTMSGDIITFCRQIMRGKPVAVTARQCAIFPVWKAYILANLLRGKRKPMSSPTEFDLLVQTIETKCFNGKFPATVTPEIILGATMRVFPHLAEATPQVKIKFSKQLLAAAAARIRIRLSQPSADWVN